MLRQRVITALVGIPIMIGAIFFSKLLLALILALLTFIGIYELQHLGRRIGFNPPLVFMFILGLSFIVLAYFNNNRLFNVLAVAVLMLGLVFFLPIFKGLPAIGFSFLGSLYIGWSFAHGLLLINSTHGSFLLLAVFLATWAADTFAYFAGKSLGRHKLAPTISPHKTWEGSIGGIIGTIIIMAVYSVFLPWAGLWQFVFLGLILSISGQLGDLFESYLKRKAKVKDSGNIFPGHGGVLDRFDSFVINTTVAYYFMQWFIIK